MGISYRIYVELRFAFEMVCEMIRNSLRWTPFGPKKFVNLPKTMAGQVVVITGANTGIGKVNATLFARLGAKVVMACRDTAKAHIAADDIRKQVATAAGADGSGRPAPTADVLVLKLDLSSLASVRQFVRELAGEVDRVDILVNNAGLMFCPNWRTEDGFEMQLGTNHMGHFLLTHLLIDKLKKSANARVVNVSSIAHIRGALDFEDIQSEKSYDKYRAYSQSKLANVLFTRELAVRLSGTNIRCYALHPGLINTDLQRHLTGCLAVLFRLCAQVVQISAELGAQTTHYCALEPSLASETGRYYKNCGRVDSMVGNAADDLAAKKLWEISCKAVDIDEKYKY